MKVKNVPHSLHHVRIEYNRHLLKIGLVFLFFFQLLFGFSQEDASRVPVGTSNISPTSEKQKYQMIDIEYRSEVYELANKLIVLSESIVRNSDDLTMEHYSKELQLNISTYPFSTFTRIEKKSLLYWVNENFTLTEKVIEQLQLFNETILSKK